MANTLKLSAVGLLALLAAGMFAQTATTTPVGFVTLNFRDGTVSPKQDAFYLGLTDTPTGAGLLVGKISSVTATTLTVSGAGWTPGAFSAVVAPYLVRITSGAALGTTWQISTTAAGQNTVDTLTLSDAGLSLVNLGVVANDGFEILPLDTLATLFGTEMLAGTSAATADNVAIHNGLAWSSYYYHTDGHWYRAGTSASPVDNVPLRPDVGFIVTRRGPAKSLVLVGRAPSTDLRIRFGRTKDTFIGTFPMSKTLAQIGFETTPGWAASANSVLADKVSLWNGLTWVSYFYTGTQWERVGLAGVNAGTAGLQTPERAMLVSKIAPASAFLAQQKPY